MTVTGAGNVLFLYDPISDRSGVSITASSAAAGLPVSNLLDMRPKKIWQATGAASEWVNFDAGAGNQFDIDTIGLVAFNNDVDGSVRIQIGDDPTYAVTALDQTFEMWPPVWGLGDQFGYYFGGYPALSAFAQYTYFRVIQFLDALGNRLQYSGRYTRRTFTNPTLAAGVQQLGRDMSGVAYQPSRNFQYGWKIEWIDPSQVKRTDGGGVVANRKPKYRRITIQLGTRALPLKEALNYANTMIRIIGNTRPVLVVLFPQASTDQLYQTSAYCLLTSTAAIVGENAVGATVAQLVFEELATT
jgi:hypothetical protein